MQITELNTHLNGDEAMCFGAAFLAANSSASFKVRKVYLSQHPNFDIAVRIRPLSDELNVELANPEEDGIDYHKDVVLYKTEKDYLGQKKTISLTYDVNMRVDAFAQYPDGSETPLQTFTLDNITKIVEMDIAKSENSTRPKVSLQFELSRSHLLRLLKAEIKFEETKLEEIIVEKKETKKEESSENTESSEKSPDDKSEDQKTQENGATDSDGNSEQKEPEVEK